MHAMHTKHHHPKKTKKMRLTTALFALPLASAFHPLATSPNAVSRSLSRRTFVPSTLSVSRAEVTDSVQVSDQEEPWWKNYELAHADVAQQTRSDFPILSRTVGDDNKPLVYLDSAATSQKPRQVLDCLQEYYQEYNANVHRGAHLLSRDATAAYEAARDSIALFIGAENRNEIVFTSGATEAINLVANSYGRSTLQKGDEIVLTEMEHHSNLVPWQMVAQATGATIKYVKVDSATGGLDLEHFSTLLNEHTKIVGVQHVSNVMGCINPVEDIVKMVREKSTNARIVLDACQSLPHQTVNVKKLGVDFVAASGHKMCAPTGIGFLWAPEGLLNSMPPFLGGGEMIDQVTLEGSTYALAPARFEAGTPAIAQAIGMGAAVTYLQNIGMDRIEAYEHELADYLYRRLSDIDGVTTLGPPAGTPRAALCAFVCDNVHASDLSTFLDIEGVAIRAGHHCCQPLHQALGYSHSARASLYFYNTKEYVVVHAVCVRWVLLTWLHWCD
jgi:cysteine desulfurase/selenocysteine lyase